MYKYMYTVVSVHQISKSCFFLCADVTAIIFVIACSSFNMVIREDEETVSTCITVPSLTYMCMYCMLLLWSPSLTYMYMLMVRCIRYCICDIVPPRTYYKIHILIEMHGGMHSHIYL